MSKIPLNKVGRRSASLNIEDDKKSFMRCEPELRCNNMYDLLMLDPNDRCPNLLNLEIS